MRRALALIAGSQGTMHADTDAIKEVLYRYSLMVDRRRWELIEEVFTSDATIDYTRFTMCRSQNQTPHPTWSDSD
jgi:hypothetical protein